MRGPPPGLAGVQNGVEARSGDHAAFDGGEIKGAQERWNHGIASERSVTEGIPSRAMYSEPSKMPCKGFGRLEREHTPLEEPSNVVEALVVAEDAAAFDEVADEMREEVFIGHANYRRDKERRVILGPREHSGRGSIEQPVWEEAVMHVDAERPGVACEDDTR